MNNDQALFFSSSHNSLSHLDEVDIEMQLQHQKLYRNLNMSQYQAFNLGLKAFQIGIYKTLRSNQIQKDLAFFLVLAHDCHTEAQALELLVTDENDYFAHLFLPQELQSDSCLICSAPRQRHVRASADEIAQATQQLRTIQQKLYQLERQVQNKINKQVMCQICLQ